MIYDKKIEILKLFMDYINIIKMDIFASSTDLFNQIIYTNSQNIIYANISGISVPLSNKYYMTLYDIESNNDFKKFFDFIKDDSRTIDFPFEKNNDNLTNHYYPEIEQFMHLDLNEHPIKFSNKIEKLKNCVEESNADTILIIEIEYLINFLLMMSNATDIQNNIYEMLIFQLNQIKPSNIYIVDSKKIVNCNNLLYVQLELCMKNYNCDLIKTFYNLDKNIDIIKNISDVQTNIYWILLNTDNYEKIDEILSPINNNTIDVIKIDTQHYFKYTLSLFEIIDKNLYQMNHQNDNGFLIEPFDRIRIVI